MTGAEFPRWIRQTRKPTVTPPPGSWDCAPHIYGDPANYPVRNTLYEPVDADIDDLVALHRTLGIDKGVLVQPMLYGTDHRVLLDALKITGGRYRATGIVDDTLSDGDLAVLDAKGFCNARYNIFGILGIKWDRASFERSTARIAELGWSATLHLTGPELVEWEPVLRRVRIPVVIDHLGHVDVSDGVDPKPLELMIDLLKEGWWIKLSNGDRASLAGYPFDDTIDVAQRLIAAAPDRCIWGTDWPHPRYLSTMPNDADLIELLFRYAPDAAQRHKILVDNPERLFGRQKI